jgi:hypothetical protein
VEARGTAAVLMDKSAGCGQVKNEEKSADYSGDFFSS